MGLLVAALLWSAGANAQNKDASRAAARDLGYSGVESYQAADYDVAIQKLDKAYQVLQVPSLGLWSARALIKTNRWVEAAERLRQVLALEVKGGDAAVQQQALREAKQELDALTPRLPSLVVDVRAAPSDMQVTVDDDALSPALLLGEAVPANPGRHVIVARASGRELRREVTLEAGKREAVELVFAAAEGPGAAAANAPDADLLTTAARAAQGDASPRLRSD